MKKIDKTKILSIQYKKWVEKLDSEKKTHPVKSRFYTDVIMNLLHCQDGVCAYTEFPLCDSVFYREDKWANGTYTSINPENIGELDHFESKLKKKKYWQWDNLFVVLEKINRLKGNKPVDYILKPDSPLYDPIVLLEYDKDFHVFIPNRNITDKETKLKVKHMINVLNLNYDYVRSRRKKYLDKVFKLRQYEPEEKIECFFTAYKMMSEQNRQSSV